VTGRAKGKLELKKAKVFLRDGKKIKLIDTVVYIHLKGYALARVTHLDIEHKFLDKIILPKRGNFLSIHGIKNGIEIILEKKKKIKFKNKMIEVKAVEVLHPYLAKLLKKTRTWVGGKFGGIYIGFRKSEIIKLEKIASKKFGIM